MSPTPFTLLGQVPQPPSAPGQFSSWMVWLLLFAAVVLVLLAMSRRQDRRR